MVTKKTTKSKATRPKQTVGLMETSVSKEFITEEANTYSYSLGNLVASSFSGFIAGIVVTSLIWIVVVSTYFTN